MTPGDDGLPIIHYSYKRKYSRYLKDLLRYEKTIFAKLRLPGQAKHDVAKREKARRKRMGLTQAELASKADVSLGSLRRFQQTGDISFASLVSICYALNCQDELDGLFSAPAYRTIQEVIDEAR